MSCGCKRFVGVSVGSTGGEWWRAHCVCCASGASVKCSGKEGGSRGAKSWRAEGGAPFSKKLKL